MLSYHLCLDILAVVKTRNLLLIVSPHSCGLSPSSDILEDLTSDQAPVVFPVWLCGVHLFEFAAHVNLNICFESHMLASNLQFTWVMGPYSESRSCVFVPFTSLRSVIRLNSI